MSVTTTRRKLLQAAMCSLFTKADLPVSQARSQETSSTGASLGGKLRKVERAFDFARDFGGNGDGSSDNSESLRKFNFAAREESRVGAAVKLNIESGSYLFDHSKCQNYLEGIADLEINGFGSIFTNIYDPSMNGRNFNYELPWGRASLPLMNVDGVINSKIITNITKGTNHLQCEARLDDFFIIGRWYIITSLDIQYYGYPPNVDRFEFVQIVDLDRKNGNVFLGSNIIHNHRMTFPDGGSELPCGRPRIWNLDREGASWDVVHAYNGLQINKGSHTTLPYMTITGKSFRFYNCILPGVSQSIAMDVSIVGGKLLHSSEPDKLVELCVYDGVDMLDVTFQSSSINKVIIKNCNVSNSLNSGGAKNVEIMNCTIEKYDCKATCGSSRDVVVTDCEIAEYEYFRRFLTDTPQVEIQKGIFYKDGCINLPKKPSAISAWNVVPGLMIYMCGPDDRFVGDIGSGIVTDIQEDDRYVKVKTDLPFRELPTWASGRFRLVRGRNHIFKNSFGCDAVTSASYASEVGRSEWQTFKRTVTSTNFREVRFYGNVGWLTSARFEIVRVTKTEGCSFVLKQHNAREGGPFGVGGDLSFEFRLDRPAKVFFERGSATHDLNCGVVSYRGESLPSLADFWLDGTLATIRCVREQEFVEFPSDAEIIVVLELDIGRFRQSMIAPQYE